MGGRMVGRLLVPALALVLVGCTAQMAGTPRGAASTDDDVGLGTKVFDESALEGDGGVRKILVENYNEPAEDIAKIDCPADQEVKQGNTFECTATIRDEEKTIKITVVDDDGQYEVSTPQDK